jgi:peptide/nickel transport system permease protein
MSLLRYIGIRVFLSAILLVGVTIVTFLLTHVVPADPVQAQLGEQASNDPAVVAEVRARLQLDRPLPVQYWSYLDGLVHGDLGKSYTTGLSVRSGLEKAFPATIELAIAAIIVAVIIGIGLGLWSAVRRGHLADQVIRVVSLIGVSAPTFWTAIIGSYFFFVKFHILPGSGQLSPTYVSPPRVTGMKTVDSLLAGETGTFLNSLAHLVLPAAVLALLTIGTLTRFSRSAILEVLNSDYVRAARAKGLPARRVLFGYVLRGSSVPILTVAALAFGSLMAGTVLTETVFSWNGLGQYAFEAATSLDLSAIMGVSLVIACVYIVVNLLVDVIYGFIDPRVRQA